MRCDPAFPAAPERSALPQRVVLANQPIACTSRALIAATLNLRTPIPTAEPTPEAAIMEV